MYLQWPPGSQAPYPTGSPVPVPITVSGDCGQWLAELSTSTFSTSNSHAATIEYQDNGALLRSGHGLHGGEGRVIAALDWTASSCAGWYRHLLLVAVFLAAWFFHHKVVKPLSFVLGLKRRTHRLVSRSQPSHPVERHTQERRSSSEPHRRISLVRSPSSRLRSSRITEALS